MNLFRWLHRSQAQCAAVPPPVAAALPRLRRLREEREWEPVTPWSTVQHRAERVEQARRKIAYHPLPPERLPEWKPTALQRLLLVEGPWGLMGLGGFIAIVMTGVVVIELTQPGQRGGTTSFGSNGYYFPAPTATYLTEAMAIGFAKEALVRAGLPTEAWTLSPHPTTKQTWAADGTPERYLFRTNLRDLNAGMLFFKSANSNQGPCIVSVQLQNNGVTCQVNPPPPE